MRILKDKRGNSTLIYSVVAVFFLCAVTVLVIGSIELRSLTLNVTHTAKTVLDEYISEETKSNIDSIKNSVDYVFKIDESEYNSLLEKAVGSKINIENISLTSSNNLDIELKFTLKIPFVIWGDSVIYFDREIVITGKYSNKF